MTTDLTHIGIMEGVWEGLITGSDSEPDVTVSHLQRPITGVEVTQSPGGWSVRVPVPPETLSDGVQTYVVQAGDDVIGRFAIAAGSALDDDIRAEVDLLRAELDMLKSAFRRHCVETAGDG